MKVSSTLINIQTNLNNAYLSSNNVKSVRYIVTIDKAEIVEYLRFADTNQNYKISF
jgi:hypothetical protein